MLEKTKAPVIVILGYNRPEPLNRILKSISKAKYPQSLGPITLIISIDNGGSIATETVAKQFQWDHGKKEVILHKQRLGMKNHSLFCGDLTNEYETIIFLEDDSYVSPYFYEYSLAIKDKYSNIPSVAGASLYSFQINEFTGLNFVPINDGYDNYFAKSATTWGVVWTREQWIKFRSWMSINGESTISQSDGVPLAVTNWPKTSWKKYINKYLSLTDKYFVYPRVSLITNFADPGTHFGETFANSQVNILISSKKWNLSTIEQSLSIYDPYFELEEACYKKLNPELEPYSFVSDIYSLKDLSLINSEYILTVRDASEYKFSFGFELHPPEQNVIQSYDGKKILLAKTSKCKAQNLVNHTDIVLNLHKNLGLTVYSNIFRRMLRSKINFLLKNLRKKYLSFGSGK